MGKKIIITAAVIVAAIIIAAAVKNKFPLKKGSRGFRVRRLQDAINAMAMAQGNIDPVTESGRFDAETEQALYLTTGLRQVNKEQYDSILEASKS